MWLIWSAPPPRGWRGSHPGRRRCGADAVAESAAIRGPRASSTRPCSVRQCHFHSAPESSNPVQTNQEQLGSKSSRGRALEEIQWGQPP